MIAETFSESVTTVFTFRNLNKSQARSIQMLLRHVQTKPHDTRDQSTSSEDGRRKNITKEHAGATRW